MGEGHIDGDGCFSRFSFDTTEGDDFLASGNKLFGDKVNVKSFIEAGEKPIEHVLKALKMAATHGHPFWHIVDDVRRLETAQRLAMSWDGSFVERANALLVFFFDHFFLLRPLYSSPMFTEHFSVVTWKLCLTQYSATASSG
jgi:hypothetical protein